MFKILLFISSFIAFVVGGLVVLIGIGAITGIARGLIVMCGGGVITFLAVCTALAVLLPEPEKRFVDARPTINLIKRNGKWA